MQQNNGNRENHALLPSDLAKKVSIICYYVKKLHLRRIPEKETKKKY